ncbi:hypothetical protein Desor_2694 [Desulfosporosinus orientis DSM 765]|uniref:PucR C-terminal helix-turn-helix domain-containing protein n=1 Tax=Desulfosporosinus orientis (strain ATCC 19365 / DSM 765 / NCIMB 8382 / VKM B-1628 / Singapore I) TaxID=768706 RepID=G7W930_DESOD|nr:helix-turn-helix domain-containing protein [Desulfosporosinus orientis]AET68239.1 hypothetical protein Desor_2694 [Desulfosporosinus orientis DSM 765]
MNLNMHMLLDEFSDLNPVSFLNDSIDLTLSSIAWISPQAVFSPDTLYLGSAADLMVYDGNLKDANLISLGALDSDFALRNQCNIISFTEALSIDQIASLIFKIQKKYDEWNNRMLSAIVSKQPMQKFFDIGLDVIHNPMILVGPLNTLILAVGEIPGNCSDSIWRELLDQGYVSYEHPLYNEFLKAAYKYPNEDHPFTVKIPKHNFTYLISNLFQDGKRSGALMLNELKHPFTTGQLTLVKYFGSILEQAIKSTPDFQILSSNANSFVYQLLKHVYLKENIITNCLKSIGWKVYDEYYCLYFIRDHRKHVKDVLMDVLSHELSWVFPTAMILDYKNGIIVILRNSDFPFDQNNLRAKLLLLIERFSLTIGISSIFYDFKNLKRHYDECNLALKYGQDGDQDTSVHFFQDYVIRHLTRFIFVENGRNQFIHTKIELLHKYDQRNKTDLVKTLLTYFQFGQSKSLAAEQMHLHRNTLTYRLGIINKLIGIDCTHRIMDENEILHIMLSSKFIEYQSV